MKKINKSTIVFAFITLAVIAFFLGMIHYGNQCTESKYSLFELNEGVYAIYYNTHSRVPADNYEVVTVNCNGNIHTYKGHVSISYTDVEPYIIVQDINWVNADKMYIYVPQGTVVYEGSVNVGR